MGNISRRAVLAGVTISPAAASSPDDSELLAQCKALWPLLEKRQELHDKWWAERARVEVPDFTKQRQRRRAFIEKHERGNLCQQTWAADEIAGRAAQAIFRTPAQTVHGALEKLRIADFAINEDEYSDAGQADLTIYQEGDAMWLQSVIDDLERLAGSAAS